MVNKSQIREGREGGLPGEKGGMCMKAHIFRTPRAVMHLRSRRRNSINQSKNKTNYATMVACLTAQAMTPGPPPRA